MLETALQKRGSPKIHRVKPTNHIVGELTRRSHEPAVHLSHILINHWRCTWVYQENDRKKKELRSRENISQTMSPQRYTYRGLLKISEVGWLNRSFKVSCWWDSGFCFTFSETSWFKSVRFFTVRKHLTPGQTHQFLNATHREHGENDRRWTCTFNEIRN